MYKSKRLVDAFIKTDNPIALDRMLGKEARVRSETPNPMQPCTIALCSAFAKADQLKHFPGFQKLIDQCRQEDSRLEWNYGWVKNDGKLTTSSLIIKIDPQRPFTYFREAKTSGLPIYHIRAKRYPPASP